MAAQKLPARVKERVHLGRKVTERLLAVHLVNGRKGSYTTDVLFLMDGLTFDMWRTGRYVLPLDGKPYPAHEELGLLPEDMARRVAASR
jgi:hypothetical protein